MNRLSRNAKLITGLVFSLGVATSAHSAEGWETSGYISLDYSLFTETANDTRQHDQYAGSTGELEFYRSWGDNSVTITPFARLSQHDNERNHLDFREANWLHIGDDWEVRAGISKVFWGTAESQHLVDIINQTDTLEGVDGEDKLGQPMLSLTLIRDWGDLQLFWLPYFRERDFAGDEGRLRPQPRIDSDYSTYESEDEQSHQDFAARWVHTIGDLDLAVSYFQGTSREPALITDTDDNSQPILRPHYEQIRQAGLELTWVVDSWLWKAEAIHRSGMSNKLGNKEDYSAAVAGFEYTFVGAGGGDTDIGLLMEYHLDERGARATTPYQNDLFVGLRFAFNDMQSSEILTGVIFDNDNSATIGLIEASRRLGDNMKLELEARLFNDFDSNDPLAGFEQDDYILLTWSYYF